MLNAVEAAKASRDTRENEDLTEGGAPAKRRRGGTGVRVLRGLVQFALMIAVLAVSYMAMNRLLEQRPARTARPVVSNSLPVEAVTARIDDERPTIHLYGEIAAARAVEVRPSVGGEVVSVNPSLRAGLQVAKGDTLFEIDSFDYEAALAEAKANLAQTEAAIRQAEAQIDAEKEQLEYAQNQLDLGRSHLERAQQLSTNGALTAQEVDNRELVVSQREQAVSTRRNNLLVEQAQLDQQLATKDRLEWSVRQAERALENTKVTAPFSGVISTSNVEEGRLVSANEVAVSLYDGDALEVRFTLTDAQYGRVATDNEPLIGREVQLAWNVGGRDYDYTAKVVRIGAEVASDRGGVDVYAELQTGDEAVQIRPGAFVAVTVPDRLYPDSYRIPETAIYDGTAVYLIVDGSLQRRDVTVAAYDGADVIVTDGLEPGDRVLTTRLSRIDDGLEVTVPGADANPAGPEGDEAAPS